MFSYFTIEGQSVFQTKIDSILVDLKTTLKPQARIAKQLKLVGLYKYAHPDVDSLIETSLYIAKERGLKFFIARSLKFRARYGLYNNISRDSILSDIQGIEAISKTIDNKLLPAWISRLYSEYYILTSDLDKAEIYIDSLTIQIKRNKGRQYGPLHTVRGMYFQKRMDYNRAIEEYKKALTFKLSGRTFILNNLGRLHLELQNPEKAMRFAHESIDFGSREINTIPKLESLSIIGEAYLDLGDTLKSITYFEEVEMLRSNAYMGKNYTCLQHLIDIYKKNDPLKVDSLLADLSSYELIDEYPKLITEKGRRSLEKGDINTALKYCKEGLVKSESRFKYEYASNACDCLVDIYQDSNNTGEVSKYLFKKINLQTKLDSKKRIISLARNLANFETEKEKALLKQAHEKDQEILSERLGKYKLGGIMGLFIIAIGGLALWQLKKKNNRIASQNQVISKSLTEKDILLREIHHRVKNNLQLVSSLLTLQGQSIDDKTARLAITEGKNRVRSMALIHQNLYNKENLTNISVKEYLEKLTQELFYTYKIDADKIKLKLDIQDLDLDIDTLVPLGLIINELITNCLKYAFPDNREGLLEVKLYKKEQQLVLNVNDNGVGYDQNHTRSSSFGSTLISALTEQLEGKLDIESGNGTNAAITIPLSEK